MSEINQLKPAIFEQLSTQITFLHSSVRHFSLVSDLRIAAAAFWSIYFSGGKISIHFWLFLHKIGKICFWWIWLRTNFEAIVAAVVAYFIAESFVIGSTTRVSLNKKANLSSKHVFNILWCMSHVTWTLWKIILYIYHFHCTSFRCTGPHQIWIIPFLGKIPLFKFLMRFWNEFVILFKIFIILNSNRNIKTREHRIHGNDGRKQFETYFDGFDLSVWIILWY